MKRNPVHHEDHNVGKKVVAELHRIHEVIRRLTDVIESGGASAQRGRTIPAITLVKETPMSTPVEHKTFSDLKTQLNSISTLPDGTPDPDAVVTWESSDPSQVGVEVNPAGGYFITTPLESGTAVITSKTVSPGKRYAEATINFSYLPAPVGETVAVIGADVSDL